MMHARKGLSLYPLHHVAVHDKFNALASVLTFMVGILQLTKLPPIHRMIECGYLLSKGIS